MTEILKRLGLPVEVVAASINASGALAAACIVSSGVGRVSDALNPEGIENIQVEVSRSYGTRLVAYAQNYGTASGVLMSGGTIVASDPQGVEIGRFGVVLGTSAGVVGSSERYILGPGEASVLDLQLATELPSDAEECTLEFRTMRIADSPPRRSSQFACSP